MQGRRESRNRANVSGRCYRLAAARSDWWSAGHSLALRPRQRWRLVRQCRWEPRG